MVLFFRKLYRLSGLIFPLIYYFSDQRTTLIWLSSFALLFVVLEISRFSLPRFNLQFFKIFEVILKQESQGRLLGTTYFIFGTLLTVILFPKDIAIAAILFLIFGDAFSALVGVKFGRIKIGQKSLEGSLAFLAICFFIAIVLRWTHLRLGLGVSLWGAFAATLTELLPLPVNDNLSIPLFSALVMVVVAS